MASKTTKRFKGKIRDDYLELVMQFPLTSIRSEKDLSAAQKVLDQLLAGGDLSDGAELYLDALSDLVSAYEDDHYEIPQADDADLLRHLMEANGLSQADLHRQTGIAKSTISELLSGKKTFTRKLIAKLSEFFNVDKGLLANNL